MARRAYCSECGKEVWLGRNGCCQFGHPASALSGIHEAAAPALTPGSGAGAPSGAAPAAAGAMPPTSVAAPVEAVASGAMTAAVARTAAVAMPAPSTASPVPEVTLSPADAGFALPEPERSIGDTECLVRRVLARILDEVLLGVTAAMLFVIYLLIAQMAYSGTGTAFFSRPVATLASLLGLTLQAAYFCVLPSMSKGRTVGKAIFGIAITDERGEAPSIVQGLVREVAWAADGLFMGIAGLLIAAWMPEHQRVGDLLAKTVVVRYR
jgi:uncharacterized RDD family membrane protein YckC